MHLAINNDEPAEIQVSGGKLFDTNHWREAVLYFLFGVWGDEEPVMYRPKIGLPPNLTLRLATNHDAYYAYGDGGDAKPPEFWDEQKLVVGSGQLEVENGLVRFVKNNRIEMLQIDFPEGTTLCLWKGQRRGELNCWSDVDKRHPWLDER
jgi:hypothetical protein